MYNFFWTTHLTMPRTAAREKKHWFFKCKPATWRVWPFALLMVVEKASLSGNLRRLKVKYKSERIIGSREIRTASSLAHPVRTMVSTTFCFNPYTISLVQSLGASKFRISVAGMLYLKLGLWGETPGSSKVLRNSTEYCVIWFSSRTVSIDW